jgi:putative hydrolase of the HAD superfamily
MIKGVIFDFGGVLMRTEDYGPRYEWDRRLGLPLGSVERIVHQSELWVQAQLGRVTPKGYWVGVGEMLRMRDQEQIAQLRQDYFSGDRLDQNLVGLIRELKTSGYRVGLLSNESMQLPSKLAELDIDRLFDNVTVSAYIGAMKPDPTAYRVALRGLNVAPQEAIFVDDVPQNVQGAVLVGLQAILFERSMDLRAELCRYLKLKA